MKTYKKAEILFVSFELSQSIAAGCEAISNYAYGSCQLYVGDSTGDGLSVFTDDLDCVITTPEEADKVCYDVPNDNNNVYSS